MSLEPSAGASAASAGPATASAGPAAAPDAGRLRAAGAFSLPETVTAANARAVLGQALPALEAARPLYDLSGCRHFDSSLIAVLLELSRAAAAGGRRCAFLGAAPNLRKLAGLYGIDAVLFGEDSARGAAGMRPAP